jgi:hypothetical protein
MDLYNCGVLFLMFLLAYATHLAAAWRTPEPPPKAHLCLRIRVEPPPCRDAATSFVMGKNAVRHGPEFR